MHTCFVFILSVNILGKFRDPMANFRLIIILKRTGKESHCWIIATLLFKPEFPLKREAFREVMSSGDGPL